MSSSQKMAKIFLEQFKAVEVLPSLHVEYEEIGRLHRFWLWITRQERPIKYPPLPMGEGDTITFRRPNPYGGEK